MSGLLTALVVVGALVLWLLNAVMGNKQQQGPPRARPDKPRGPTPASKQIHVEIEEFLARNKGQRKAPSSVPKTARPAGTRPSKQPAQRPPRPLSAPLQVSEAASDGPQTHTSVAAHVQQHMDTREFAERAEHLTNVDQADEQMEAHLKEKFSHQLGTLSAQRMDGGMSGDVAVAAQSVPANSPAAGVLRILTNQDQLRSAILLTELLRRPEERW